MSVKLCGFVKISIWEFGFYSVDNFAPSLEWFLKPSETVWHVKNLQMVPFIYFPFLKDADFNFHVYTDPVKYSFYYQSILDKIISHIIKSCVDCGMIFSRHYCVTNPLPLPEFGYFCFEYFSHSGVDMTTKSLVILSILEGFLFFCHVIFYCVIKIFRCNYVATSMLLVPLWQLRKLRIQSRDFKDFPNDFASQMDFLDLSFDGWWSFSLYMSQCSKLIFGMRPSNLFIIFRMIMYQVKNRLGIVMTFRLIIRFPLHSCALDYLILKFLSICYVYLVRMGLGCVNEDDFQHLCAVTHWVLSMCELSFCYQLKFLLPLLPLFPGVFPFRFGLNFLLLLKFVEVVSDY